MEILCIEKSVYSGRPGSFNCFTSSFILVSQFGEVEIFRYFHMQVIYECDVVGNSIKPVTRHFCRIWISIFTQCVLYMWDFNSSTVDDACQAPHCRHSERWTLFRLRARHDIGVVMICRRNSLLLAQVEHKYWFSIKILALDYVVVVVV